MIILETAAYQECVKTAKFFDIFKHNKPLPSTQGDQAALQLQQIKNQIQSLTTQRNIARNEGNMLKMRELDQQILDLRQQQHDLYEAQYSASGGK